MTRRIYGSGTIEAYRRRHRARAARLANGRRPVLGIFDTAEEAERALDAHAHLMVQSGLATGGAMTLRAYGPSYLDAREAEGARNIRTDRSRWKLHIATAHFADWPLGNIEKKDVKEWLASLAKSEAADVKAALKPKGKRGPKPAPKLPSLRKKRRISPQTRKHCLNLLRKALDASKDDGYVRENPAAGVKAPKVGEIAFDYLRPDEQLAIERCERIPEADRLRAMFAWGTGIRQFDQWTMKVTDLRIDRADPDMVFWCHKLERRVRVPLFGVALRAAKRWLELLAAYSPDNPRGLLWPLPGGSQRQRSKTYGWREMLAAAGVKRHVKWHELRDTCASSLLSGWWGRAWRLEEVKEMLVHSSIEVTERYAHLAPAVLAKAAAETIGHRPATGGGQGGGTTGGTPRPPEPKVRGSNPLWRTRESEGDSAPDGFAPDGILVAKAQELLSAMARGEHSAGRLAVELAEAVLDAHALDELAERTGGDR